MGTMIRYTLLTALRDWLFIGLFLLVLCAYALSAFLGGTALVEEAQMTLSFFAGSARASLIIGLIVFTCFHVRRLFENREIETILSKPISRTSFVLSYWIAFSVLALIALIPVALVLFALNRPDMLGAAFWLGSFFFEIILVLAFAFMASLILGSAVSSVMATFAFYLISRLMGFFVAALSTQGSLISNNGIYSDIMGFILKVVSTVLPRLDLYAKSSWLVYGVGDQPDLWIFAAQSAVFIPLLLATAVFDFKRKQF